jgi:hypothetical protein
VLQGTPHSFIPQEHWSWWHILHYLCLFSSTSLFLWLCLQSYCFTLFVFSGLPILMHSALQHNSFLIHLLLSLIPVIIFITKINMGGRPSQCLMPVTPATWEAEIGKIVIWGHQDPITTNKLGVVIHTCHPSYLRSINRRIIVQDSLGTILRSYLREN